MRGKTLFGQQPNCHAGWICRPQRPQISLVGLLYIISVLELTTYSLSHNQIATLDGFVIPNSLNILGLVFFLYLSVLELTTYSLSHNQLVTMSGLAIPDSLIELE